MSGQVTQNEKILAKVLLLFSMLIIFTATVQTFAAEQKETKQKADLTELSIEDLMNVEVVSTATLTKTTPRLVPSAMTTITDEQIKASGARSLNELLDIYVPNLQLIRHHWEADHIGLRGIYGENKYLLLVNGRIMNERTHYGAMSERDQVLLSDIQHVDVVRGPGSALYGPGAVSMVINVITYNADTFQGTEVTSRAGAIEEFYSAEVKHGQKFDDNDGGLFVYAGISKYNGANQQNAPQIFAFDFPSVSDYAWWNNDWGNVDSADPPHLATDGTKSGEPLTGLSINRDGEDSRNLPALKLHAQITRSDWDIWARYTRGGKQFVWDVGPLTRDQWGYADYEQLWHRTDPGGSMLPPNGSAMVPLQNYSGYQQLTGFIGHKQELTGNLDIDYSFSYETLDFERVQSNITSDAYREDDYHGKAILQWQPNDKHKIAFGTEISYQNFGLPSLSLTDVSPRTAAFVSGSNPLGLMPEWSTTMYSLLGEDQWTINDQWTTFLGARLDKHTYTNYMFSPRAAVVHTPNGKDTYKLMWSRSVRANYDGEMKANADSGGGMSAPEKLDSVELRYERQQSKNLDLAASLFVHYNLALVDWSQNDLTTIPVGTQRDYGLEFEAAYHTDTTRLLLSHSFTKLYGFTLADPCLVTFTTAKPYGASDDLANWSNHLTKLAFQQKLNDQWTFNATMRVYWGFPGMKDYNRYYPYAREGAQNAGPNFATHPVVEDGWEKAYRGNYYLNLGLQYQPSKNLTIGVTGYNLLGIFGKDLNKRNYMSSSGDYRDDAVAVGVSVAYKF